MVPTMPTAATTSAPRPDPGTRVGAEFIGKARSLRQQLHVSSLAWTRGSVDLLAPFCATNTGQLSRGTLLARLPTSWKALPRHGCLRLDIDRGNSTSIIEARAIPYSTRDATWADDADENGIALAVRRVTVQVRPRAAVDDQATIKVIVGLHALGRFFQRSFDNSTPSLIIALAALLDEKNRTRGRGKLDIDVPCAVGTWRGGAAKLDRTYPVLAIRTFVS
jgi:hypothetical protein